MKKKKKRINLHIPDSLFKKLEYKHLLLDTCVFIDLFNHPNFIQFFNQCRKNKITLVTIDPVITEFTRGFENLEKLKKKKAFLLETLSGRLIDSDKFSLQDISKLIVDEGSCLAINSKVMQGVSKLVELYKEDGKGVSLTDFMLGSTLLAHKDLYLLTRNTSDFPTNIFSLEGHFVIEMRKSLFTYGIYKAK